MIDVYDLGRIAYEEALSVQKQLWFLRKNNLITDSLLILEHEPVITIGRRGDPSHIVVPETTLKEKGVIVCSTERGGDVTYHGPGQIIGYPILRLKDYSSGVREFVDKVEEIFIKILNDHYLIKADRDNRYPGVWVGSNKITAIGLSIHSGITMHGFAFNVNTDLTPFNWILPCGIIDRGMTSVKELIGEETDLNWMKKEIVYYFSQVFGIDTYWPGNQKLMEVLEK